jgi:hypothetical protein
MGRSHRDCLATHPHRLRITPWRPHPTDHKRPTGPRKARPTRRHGTTFHATTPKFPTQQHHSAAEQLNHQFDAKSRLDGQPPGKPLQLSRSREKKTRSRTQDWMAIGTIVLTLISKKSTDRAQCRLHQTRTQRHVGAEAVVNERGPTTVDAAAAECEEQGSSTFSPPVVAGELRAGRRLENHMVKNVRLMACEAPEQGTSAKSSRSLFYGHQGTRVD